MEDLNLRIVKDCVHYEGDNSTEDYNVYYTTRSKKFTPDDEMQLRSYLAIYFKTRINVDVREFAESMIPMEDPLLKNLDGTWIHCWLVKYNKQRRQLS